jgi:hypothetical protein
MQGISVSIVSGLAQLDCRVFNLSDDAIADIIGSVTQLLSHLLLAEQAKALLADPVLQVRLTGIAAQDMVVQASILHAVYQAQVLHNIATGHSSIADHGFPEFRGETAIDV